jgi:hypothetical protein
MFQMFGHELVHSRNQERLQRSLARYRVTLNDDLTVESLTAAHSTEATSESMREDAEVIEVIFGTGCDPVEGIGA